MPFSYDGKQFIAIGSVNASDNGSGAKNYTFKKALDGGMDHLVFPFIVRVIVLLMALTKRNRKGMVGALLMLMLGTVVSCGKKGTELSGQDKTMYIRIVEVDKDGKQYHSKIIRVNTAAP